MKPLKLYAELQVNPRNVAAYRKLVDYYKSCNRLDEAQAFEALIEEKFHDSHADLQQPEDDQKDSGITEASG